jgi:hypothetical protein
MPRTFDDAYFENEKGDPEPGGSGRFLNLYKSPRSGSINIHRNLQNPLDRTVRRQRQPQVIPTDSEGQLSRYDVYVGSRTLRAVQAARGARPGTSLPTLKITLLFGVGQDLDNLGLRFYFEQVDDRVLINIPGRESDSKPRWNIGISDDQIKSLMVEALPDVPYKIVTLAAYSTGYGGLNQTVNERLIPLSDIETAVYYDCTYRADRPAPASDDTQVTLTAAERNTAPDEFDRGGHPNSAFNTQRARARLLDATGRRAEVVGYMATLGSPWYLQPRPSAERHQYTVDFPTKIDLRASTGIRNFSFEQCLFALVLTRCLAYAQIDNQVAPAEVPDTFKDLASVLPPRGKVASTPATLRKPGFSPSSLAGGAERTTLLDWGRTNKDKVEKAFNQRFTAVDLISRRELMYPKDDPRHTFSYPGPGNEAGALHAGLLPEFGWEFLL